MKLAAAFIAHLPAHAASYGRLVTLEPLLESFVARASLAWPTLDLAPEQFVAHLAARLPPASHPQRTLEELAVEDLYLACCCAGGNPKALAALETTQLPSVARAVAHLATSGVLADEVTQLLRERLLITRQNAAPRIADYEKSPAPE